MIGRITRYSDLLKAYGSDAFRLIVNPVLGKGIWISIDGEKVWLNYDNSTYYHLLHSIEKLKKLVDCIPYIDDGAIIDGGANHGIFSLLAAKKFPLNKVFAIEPYHRVLPLLKKNVAGKNVKILNSALSAEDGYSSFYTTPFSDQIGSFIKENVTEFARAGEAIHEEKVPSFSLNSIMKQENIQNISVLKLDVQGAEYSILKNAGKVLEKTQYLILEVILIEKSSLELLDKVKPYYPYHKIINQLPYGADMIFSKKAFD